MPLYEYLCESCRKRFSLLRPIGERDAPAACPECNQGGARRVLSVFSALSSRPVTKSSPLGPCGHGPCGSDSCPAR